MRRISLSFLTLAITALFAITVSGAGKPADAPFWTGKPDAATFTKLQDERLTKAQQALDRMLAIKGKRTIENTLTVYDELLTYLDAAGSQSGLIQEVHPDEAVRNAAEKVSQKVEGFLTDLSLNRAVYDALSSIDLKGADAETRYYVEKTLREFRLA